jgi:hypothetical protein
MFEKIVRGIFNKEVKGREYSKSYPYSISFEDTKIKWYKSVLTNLSKGGNDMMFFTDPEMGGKKWGALLTTFTVSADKGIFTDEELKLMFMIGAVLKEFPDTFVKEKILEIIRRSHSRKNEKWEEDKESIKNLEGKDFYSLQIMGKILSDLGEDYTTYEVVIPFNNLLLVISGLMPKNPDAVVVEDLKTIANSIKIQLTKIDRADRIANELKEELQKKK